MDLGCGGECSPAGTYQPIGLTLTARQVAGWALAQYDYKAYRGSEPSPEEARVLVVADERLRAEALAIANSIWLVRDLVNQPANLMGPAELAQAATDLAALYGATCDVTVGQPERISGGPSGRSSSGSGTRSIVIDMTWGTKGSVDHTGQQGVCYDTGGLNPETWQLHAQHEERYGWCRPRFGPGALGDEPQITTAFAGSGGCC